MNSFSLPYCPARQITVDEGQRMRTAIHITGEYASFVYGVLTESLKLWAENFMIWPEDAKLPAGVTSLEILMNESTAELPTDSEGYWIRSRIEEGAQRITIAVHNERGLRNALAAFASNFITGDGGRTIRQGEEVSWPDFPIRGIVEGFYGEPWSHQDRLSMIEFLARYRFNTYMYAPKDDYYHRQKWAELYPKDEAQKIAELAKLAGQRQIEFVYSIAPGLTITYSSEEDISKLKSKLTSLADLGVRSFALLFDDISNDVVHDADRGAFASVADAHAYLTQVVWDHLQTLGSQCHMYVCPTDYCQSKSGDTGEDYLYILGKRIPPEVDILWTGPVVCSETIDASDARYFEERLRRLPVYWDNYPVNDADMTADLHIGPLEGRDASLVGKTKGFLANPMSYSEASKIALATLSEFCWDAKSYNPERAWEHALEQAVGNPASQFLGFLARSCLKSPLRPDARTPLTDIDVNDRAALHTFADQARESALYLASFMENTNLLRDIRPWLADLYYWASILNTALAGDGKRVQELVQKASAEVRTIGPDVRDIIPILID